MGQHHQIRRGAKALPLDVIAQAVPMLSRHELTALADRLIDALNSTEDDCDLEDNGDHEGIDEREPDEDAGAGYWDIDQRFSVIDAACMGRRTNVDDYPFR